MAKNSPITATAKFFPQRQIKTSPHPSCSACGHHSSHSALSSYGLFAPLTLWRLSVSLRSLVQTLESCLASGAPWSSAMAPSLERGRVINNIIQKTHILTQGWPTFSFHAPKFFATQTFISFHCSQSCGSISIL